MNRNKTLLKLKRIITESQGISEDRIKPESTFIYDLAMDSLDSIEAIIAVEKAFGISINDEDVKNILTVSQAADYVHYQLVKQRG